MSASLVKVFAQLGQSQRMSPSRALFRLPLADLDRRMKEEISKGRMKEEYLHSY